MYLVLERLDKKPPCSHPLNVKYHSEHSPVHSPSIYVEKTKDRQTCFAWLQLLSHGWTITVQWWGLETIVINNSLRCFFSSKAKCFFLTILHTFSIYTVITPMRGNVTNSTFSWLITVSFYRTLVLSNKYMHKLLELLKVLRSKTIINWN